jgi:hypothetical protein
MGDAPVRSLLLLAAVAAVVWPGLCQGANNPVAMVRKDFGSDERSLGEALRITKMDVAVDILGRTATTVITATLAHSDDRGVEGDFSLDLPAGSIITGYALDVHGAMVDGVIVDQRSGREAYENTVRRRVDPGLAEATAAGDFHTRIFPISKDAPRTIRVSFATPIEPGAAYDLPLVQTLPVETLSLSVRAGMQEGLPTLKGPEGVDLRWEGGEVAIARASADHVIPAGSLHIEAFEPSPVIISRYRGQIFFDIAPRSAASSMSAPSTVKIFWDASLSRKDDDLAGEKALLRAYLDRVAPRSVELVRFSDGDLQRSLHQGSGLADQVLKALDDTRYFGATSYRALFNATVPRDGATACLLFTDGDVTIDPYEIRDLGCPVYPVSSAPDARRDYLRVLAGKLGGQAIDLSTTDQAAALARLTNQGERVVSVTDETGAAIDYAALPLGGGWRVVGPAPKGEVRVTTTSGMRAYSTARVPSRDHAGAATLWAQAKLAEFAATARPNDKTILDFARHYSVAAPGLVFLVLETADDYAANEIEPPASLGDEVARDYRERVASVRAEKDKEKADRFGKVLALWEERKAWWTRRHRPAKTPPATVRGQAPLLLAPAPPPPPPPPASMPAPAVQPRSSQGSLDSIVADDVGQFPDRNVDGAMARVRGNSVNDVIVVGARAVRPRREIETDLAEWDPDRPYLKALGAAPAGAFDQVFVKQQAEYGSLPAFYLDVAEWLNQRGRSAEAIAMVMNVVELPGADSSTLALLALKLQRYGDLSRSIWVNEKLMALEPDRPQPRRNLALALIERAKAPASSPAERRRDLERALALLSEVVLTPWSEAYDGIEMIALMEANHLIPRLRELGATPSLDSRLIALLDVDLRVVLEWNTDSTDMDLWIDEPNRERVMYSDPTSSAGGSLSNDMTSGYGPEEYLLRRAPNGRYQIWADGYAEDRMNPNGATTARVLLYRNWGRADESVQVIDVDLKDEDEETRVGTFTVTTAAEEGGPD